MQNAIDKATTIKPILIKHPDNQTLTELSPKQNLFSRASFRNKLNKSFKAISWLLETVFRGFAGYIILVDKTPAWATTIVLVTGIYMTASSIGLMGYHFIKAYNE